MRAIYRSLSAEQASDVLTLFKAIATAEGTVALHDIHRQTLEALKTHILQHEVDIDALPSQSAEAASRLTDRDARQDVVEFGCVFALLEEQNREQRLTTLSDLASRFGQDEKFVKNMHALVERKIAAFAVDAIRDSAAMFDTSVTKQLLAPLKTFFHRDGDKKLLATYESYAKLENGTLGRELARYYQENEFALPGTPGQMFSNLLWHHDIHHVLGGYDTSPLGEMCVASFETAMVERDTTLMFLSIVAQLQAAILLDTTIATWKHQFNPEAVIEAFERGLGATTRFIGTDFDLKPLMSQSLPSVRQQLGISSGGMLVNSDADKWCSALGPVSGRHSKNMVEKARN